VNFSEKFSLVRYPGALFQNDFGIIGIIPESIPGNNRFDFFQTFFLGSQVKDTPSAVPVSEKVPLSSV